MNGHSVYVKCTRKMKHRRRENDEIRNSGKKEKLKKKLVKIRRHRCIYNTALELLSVYSSKEIKKHILLELKQ